MSKTVLSSLLERVEDLDASLADQLRKQIKTITEGREFGLVFDRHVPETVELPGRKIRVEDKVRLRTENDEQDWLVTSLRGTGRKRTAELTRLPDGGETRSERIDDLVVIADFRDNIYPGLRSLERIDGGGDKPTHIVINAENQHALRALSFAYAQSIDCIYIDPPYNTGGKASWLYNDKFVDATDSSKSAKWLAFMERRLKLAKGLLKPSGAIFVSIGDDEQHRLRMLMDQVFEPQNCVAVLTVEMSTTSGPKTTNAQQGTIVKNSEFVLIYKKSAAFDLVTHTPLLDGIDTWDGHYSLWLNEDGTVGSLGQALMREQRVKSDIETLNLKTRRGRLVMDEMDTLLAVSDAARTYVLENLSKIARVDRPPVSAAGVKPAKGKWLNFEAPDRDSNGTVQQVMPLSLNYRMSDDYRPRFGRTVIRGDLWRGFFQDMGNVAKEGGVAFENGKKPIRLIQQLVRWANNATDTVVLDFFGGSGTTTHAIMAMNVADEGTRQSILVTNNELNQQTEKQLREAGLKKGDKDWEREGIFQKVTRPRIKTVVTGVQADGSAYGESLAENVEFFELTYEDPETVRVDLAFEAVAPLLWLRAGGKGSRIDKRCETFAIADHYGVLFDPDHWKMFTDNLLTMPDLRCVFVVTDEDNLFQAVADRLPVGVDKVRLYESYLTTFMFSNSYEA